MSKRPILTTERLVLRPFNLDDAGEVRRLAGDAKIADTTLLIPHPYEVGMAEEWILTHEPSYNEGKAVTFAITAKDDGRLIGSISLNINMTHKRAEMGYWVGVPYWGRGYCTEAAEAVMRYGFKDLGLNRIFAHFMTRNPASGKVMEKIGMKYEGMLKEHVINNGKFEDLKIFGIIRDDYSGK